MSEPKAPCVCVPTAHVREVLGDLQGFAARNHVLHETLWSLMADGACSFRSRDHARSGYSCETDETQKQIITYLILVGDGRLLTYTRAPSGGETRLHGKRAAGLGGHVEERDLNYTWCEGKAVPYWRGTLDMAAKRELAEETNGALVFRPHDTHAILTHTCSPVGFINDDSDAVGRVHLGIVYKATVGQPRHLMTFAPEIADARWEDPRTLDLDLFEGWGRIIVEAMREGRIG